MGQYSKIHVMERFLWVALSATMLVATTQSTGEDEGHPVAFAARDHTSAGRGACMEFVRRISFDAIAVPRSFSALIPAGARTRLIQRLSDSDTLLVYELGQHAPDQLEPAEPDTNLRIVRLGTIAYSLALKNVRMPGEFAPDWGNNAVAMDAAQLCAAEAPLLYVITQAGNHGGWYFALQRVGTRYRFIPIAGADQGRLVLSLMRPTRAEVWSSAGPDECTACPKPFFVTTLELADQTFRIVSKRKTRRRYSGFQSHELLVKP